MARIISKAPGTALYVAVAPVGRPVAFGVIVPLKPFSGVSKIAVEPFCPATTARLGGERVSEKSGGGMTFNVSAIADVKVPEVPVIVIGVALIAAVLAAARVMVRLPLEPIELNEAVTPAGSPAAANVTAPVNPPMEVTVMGTVIEAPGVTLAAVALEESLNPAVAITVSATVAVAV